MDSARDKLIQNLLLILSDENSDNFAKSLKKLLNTFRVQHKNKMEKTQKTAREHLLHNIASNIEANNTLHKNIVEEILSNYRIQLKKSIRGAKNESTIKKILTEDKHVPKAEKIKSIENAYFKEKFNAKVKNPILDLDHKEINLSPKENLICPKCRSKGIKKNKGYNMNDFYSCIYCGFVEQVGQNNPERDLPNAAKTLIKNDVDIGE